MKSLHSNKTVLMALLLTLICASSAYAWGRGGKCPFDEESNDRQGRMDLTSEQKDQLATLRQQFIDDTAETRILLNTAYKNLNILMETSEPDKKAIKTAIKEITDLSAALLEKQINHQLEVKKLAPGLTDRKMFRGCKKMGRNDLLECMRNDRKPGSPDWRPCCER